MTPGTSECAVLGAWAGTTWTMDGRRLARLLISRCGVTSGASLGKTCMQLGSLEGEIRRSLAQFRNQTEEVLGRS